MKLIGWFLLVVGVAIAALWTLLLATGQVPEVDEGRVDIWFHLAAEIGTAVILIAAGGALLRQHRTGRTLGALAVGALAYTTVNSPGYYAESGDGAMVIMFAVLTVATLVTAVALVRADSRDEALDPASLPGGGSSRVGPR